MLRDNLLDSFEAIFVHFAQFLVVLEVSPRIRAQAQRHEKSLSRYCKAISISLTDFPLSLKPAKDEFRVFCLATIFVAI